MEEQQLLVQPKKSPNSLALKASVAYAVFFLALIYIFKAMGMDSNNPNAPVAEKIITTLVSYVPFILAIIWVQTNFRTELGGFISYGRAFSSGFRTAVYAGSLIALVMILYLKLDPTALEEIMEASRQNAGDDENALKGIEMMRPYMVYMIGFGSAVSFTFLGLLVSLISAAFVKKEPSLD